jgi:hypothetical protein
MPSELVMQAREEHSIQHVSEAASGSRIRAIEGKLPLFPAKPDHRAPLLHHCVFFGHKHWKTLRSHDDEMTALIDANAGSPSKPAKTFPEVLFHPEPTGLHRSSPLSATLALKLSN